MATMGRRVLIRGGIAVAVAAAVGLGVYFSQVELAEADQLASVIGVFVALAGLGVALYGLLSRRSGDASDVAAAEPGDRQAERNVTASGERSVAIGGDNSGIVSTGDGARNVQMNAKASGSARVYQAGGDQTINER